MKRLLLATLAAFTGCLSFAQTNLNHKTFICSYYGEPISAPISVFASSTDAKSVINNIIEVIGLEPKFEIGAANIPNAAAVISSGKRFILYNPGFIAAINQASKDKWASIAILAHEIGHHLNGHTLSGSESRPAHELEADHFSGFILRKMGATLEQAQICMQLIANEKASHTHPGRISRLVSIENGWNKATAQINGSQYIAKQIPTTPLMHQRLPSVQPVSKNNVVLNPKYVQFDVRFNAMPGTSYYITTSNNLVTVQNGQLLVLGKMISTGNTNYPLAITLDQEKAFFISKSGVIVNRKGEQAGSVKVNQKV